MYDLPFQSYNDYNFPLTAGLKSQFLRFWGIRGQISSFIFLAPKRHYFGQNDV